MKRWINDIWNILTKTNMSKKAHIQDNPNVKATQSGKLYVEETKLFQVEKVQNTVKKLLDSSIYRQIKRMANH